MSVWMLILNNTQFSQSTEDLLNHVFLVQNESTSCWGPCSKSENAVSFNFLHEFALVFVLLTLKFICFAHVNCWSTRESTPCTLIRDSENIATPGSTTRPSCSNVENRRARNTQRTIPTNPNMEEFFAGFENSQQINFLEKYNYDIKNDMPLPGRFKWRFSRKQMHSSYKKSMEKKPERNYV
ncbi:uncharacterized protein LOC130825008 [Amaranthus tricolor]|uniref:uncharacterized protein LOC130825008 n=1 Tax=Amaranthus tricolor TaxID=29722 RepID=UPI00258273CD|nr:uncharacterized protein LOC130825008 [Amaranthus tricolor]